MGFLSSIFKTAVHVAVLPLSVAADTLDVLTGEEGENTKSVTGENLGCIIEDLDEVIDDII